MSYIKREDAMNAIVNLVNCYVPISRQSEVLSDLKYSLPAADVVERKTGHWIGTEFDGYADGNPVYYEWQCSTCGCIVEDEEPNWKFCPNCGAKMNGGDDDV